MSDLHKLLREAYGYEAETVSLVSDHGEGCVWRVGSAEGHFALKRIPSYQEHTEDEGPLTEHLLRQGIRVPRMLRTLAGGFTAFDAQGQRYQLLSFVEGDVPEINTAPDWLLEAMAETLGQVHVALRTYPNRWRTAFMENFFCEDTLRDAESSYRATLAKARQAGDHTTECDLLTRLRCLPALSAVAPDFSRLTVGPTHGDYWPGQLVVQGRELTVLDGKAPA